MVLDKKEVFEKLYGPNWEVQNWHPMIRNIRTGVKSSKAHHCGECAARRQRSCYEALHYVYCSAMVVADNGNVVRCGEVLCFRSKGCLHHPFSAGYNELFRELRLFGLVAEELVDMVTTPDSDLGARQKEQRRTENAEIQREMDRQAEELAEAGAGEGPQSFANIFDRFKNRNKQDEANRRAARRTEANLTRMATREAEAQRHRWTKKDTKISKFNKSKKRMEEQRKAEERAAQREARAKTEAGLLMNDGTLSIVRRP
ncbi:uncharacterized protein EI97DRAFT_480860 [Westerdykella ornata]|uniref:Uncharacterized protein n=1 Tax=Westerdykella ornata TaxID=318751 RepID=A0A6A6JB96_WESOR|nr:uncharacterized protein EI97DRAFT_480860 [Westerdykella ornata]KAF2273453.1 hypothetical protein EI97DRAFT_480860 [Westerdykella ornata]